MSRKSVTASPVSVSTLAPSEPRSRSFLIPTVVLLLCLGVTCVSFWLAVWLYGPPNGPGTFGDAFGLANALFSGLALVGVVYAVLIQNRQIQEVRRQTHLLSAQIIHQVLAAALQEYRSIEMFTAIKGLWAFQAKHPANLVEAYRQVREQDDARIAKLLEIDRLAAEALTLHYRRQLVSRFYQILSGMVQEGVLPKDVFYRYFNRGQLKIIPVILEPIERHLDTTYNLGQSNKGKQMRALYEGSPAPPPDMDQHGEGAL